MNDKELTKEEFEWKEKVISIIKNKNPDLKENEINFTRDFSDWDVLDQYIVISYKHGDKLETIKFPFFPKVEPKLSFVMPTHNRLEWIGESMQSLLTQTEKEIEIIIVNDASTDGTTEWLKDYEANKLAPLFPYDERVKIIHNEKNMGGGESRNIGHRAASADIVAVCDDDDLNADERAVLTIKHFELNKDSEMVNFPYVSIGYYNERLEVFDGQPFDHDLYLKDKVVTYYCNPSAAYRKKSADDIGGFEKENELETDDAQFIDKWVKAGKKIDFQPGYCVTFHRTLPNSMMASKRGWSPEWVTKKS